MFRYGTQLALDQTDYRGFGLFDSAADIQAETPAGFIGQYWTGADWFVSNASGSTIYAADGSGDSVSVIDVASGTVSEFALDEFDDRIWGIALDGGRLKLLDGGTQASGTGPVSVWDFDLATGAVLSRVQIGVFPDALKYYSIYCVP